MTDEAEQVTLLIDGDVIAFMAASAANHTREDEQGFVSPFANIHEGRVIVDNMVMGLYRDLKATHVNVYLSDPESNWRQELYPAYKNNRDYSILARPLLLGRLKEYLREKYGATHWPSLEADDTIGIVATQPDKPGRWIIVGRDKDFKCIPGEHYQLGDNDAEGKPIVRTITPQAATFWHLYQTLIGDRVDGIPGCPKMGPTTAMRFMEDPWIYEPGVTKITRGPKRGEETTKWSKTPCHGNIWAGIVSCYAKEGLSEKDALLSARLVRILLNGEYDKDSCKITLWAPGPDVTARWGA